MTSDNFQDILNQEKLIIREEVVMYNLMVSGVSRDRQVSSICILSSEDLVAIIKTIELLRYADGGEQFVYNIFSAKDEHTRNIGERMCVMFYQKRRSGFEKCWQIIFYNENFRNLIEGGRLIGLDMSEVDPPIPRL